jgi:signal transduction histidine kinase
MTPVGWQKMEQIIARCRVVLSVAAILVVYIDPETPLLSRWIPFVSGRLTMDPRLFLVMLAHIVYSVAIYVALQQRWALSPHFVARTLWADVLFAVMVATMTEGVTSPSYPFFAFAVVSSALRGGMRQAMLVTVAILAIYSCLILISVRGGADVYIMRPVYLAITGYLVSYLGQQRLELQEQMRALEITEQRNHIARELHDRSAQALAGINLRLESSRRFLRENAVAEALDDLTALQDGVTREYDALRTYARSLAGLESTPLGAGDGDTHLRMRAEIAGPLELIDHVLSIAREGINNVRRHARAKTATIEIHSDRSLIHIDIDDDGVGFDRAVTPWSIASRVREIGGEVSIAAIQPSGAHLSITLPRG